MKTSSEQRRQQEKKGHIISLNSVWGDMAEEDRIEEDRVRGEDQSAREHAKAQELPHVPSKAELLGRHGADMSSFWSTLEQEDAEIEKSVDQDHLKDYERLTQEQDGQVDKATSQLQQTTLNTDRDPPLKHNDHAFLAKPIHDHWEKLEKADKAFERRVHDSPDLQMLQLNDHWEKLEK